MKKLFIILSFLSVLLVLLFIPSCRKYNQLSPNATEEFASSMGGGGPNVSLNNMELLGKKIFFDNISMPNNQSCASCHNPDYGFTGLMKLGFSEGDSQQIVNIVQAHRNSSGTEA